MTDWSRSNIVHSFHVVQVDPLNLSTVRGSLDGTVREGTLTLKYYGDTRAGLTLTTVAPEGESDGWDGTAALRLYHDWEGESEVLFTGFVTERTWSDEGGVRTWSYELNSALYAMQSQVIGSVYTIGANAMALTVLKSLISKANRKYSIAGTATDYRYGAATAYDPDKTLLSIAFDVVDKAGDRLGVDANGTVTVTRYTAPKNITPTYCLDTASDRAVTMPPVSGSDNRFEIPGRVVVSAKKDDTTVVGTASLASTSEFSAKRRGYLLDSYHSETDMTPFTAAHANELAAKYLASETALEEQVEVETMYMPMREGYVVQLAHHGETANYLVSTAALDLDTWTWKLTLKKVA